MAYDFIWQAVSSRHPPIRKPLFAQICFLIIRRQNSGEMKDSCLLSRRFPPYRYRRCAIASGDSSILLVGGVNYDRFRDALNHPEPDYLLHPADWYKFNTSLLQYNTFTKHWTHLGNYEELARARCRHRKQCQHGNHNWRRVKTGHPHARG